MPKTIQCIAYQIKTAPAGTTAADFDRLEYPGLTDQKRDIEARCKILFDAAEAARKDPKINAMATKLFVAPEFFFRGARGGVYSAENLTYLSEVMDGYLKKADYFRWIFVLGTALAVMPGTDNEILNVAFARVGGKTTIGPAASTSDSTLIYKEYISAIDFLGPNFGKHEAFRGIGPEKGMANIDQVLKQLQSTSGSKGPHAGSAANPSGTETSASGLGGATNFKMDGLQFTCEICLDHAKSRAKGTIAAADVDVHLVTSCGMTPYYRQVRNGGIYFLVDGIGNSKDLVTLEQKAAGKLNPVASVSTIDMNDKSRWKNHAGAAANLFEGGKGTVYVFPKLDM